jgi:signal transduction histidine kinase
MAVPAVSRFLGRRLARWPNSTDLIENERILATARVVLASGFLVAVYLDPTEPSRDTNLAFSLLLLYCGYSALLFAILLFKPEVTPQFTVAVHGVDVLWAAVISLFTDGPNSPFFLFFIFAILAAAFRWDVRETIFTALLAAGTTVAEGIALPFGGGTYLGGAQFDPHSFTLRAVYLTMFGCLIAYLSESEKRRRAEALSISRLCAKARLDAGLKGSLLAVLQELRGLFGSQELLLVTSDAEENQAHLWRIDTLGKTGEVGLTRRLLDPSESHRYLFAIPEDCAGAVWRSGNTTSTIVVDNQGALIRSPKCRLPAEFQAWHPSDLLIVTTVSAAPDVSARLFVLDPEIRGRPESQLRFLRTLVNQAAPGIYNVYLLRKLRSRASAIERARVARDLHDGAIQSLHAIGFRLYALRTQKELDPRERDQELLVIQQLVQREAQNIGMLIQQLKPVDFDPRHLVEFLTAMIERYRQDTGIAANFVCDVCSMLPPPRVSHELARIVQEALANVQKHSMAHNVLVKLGLQDGSWLLTIDDDGRGFEFSGRFSHSELENARRGPMIIKERVRSLGGELSIDTRPGQGARLEIKIPREDNRIIA